MLFTAPQGVSTARKEVIRIVAARVAAERAVGGGQATLLAKKWIENRLIAVRPVTANAAISFDSPLTDAESSALRAALENNDVPAPR
jgi:hypothetical protein